MPVCSLTPVALAGGVPWLSPAARRGSPRPCSPRFPQRFSAGPGSPSQAQHSRAAPRTCSPLAVVVHRPMRRRRSPADLFAKRPRRCGSGRRPLERHGRDARRGHAKDLRAPRARRAVATARRAGSHQRLQRHFAFDSQGPPLPHRVQARLWTVRKTPAVAACGPGGLLFRGGGSE